jgi:hypothetical protein
VGSNLPVRQNYEVSTRYRSQIWKNRPLNCKSFFREFPNLIRIRIGNPAGASDAAGAAARAGAA